MLATATTASGTSATDVAERDAGSVLTGVMSYVEFNATPGTPRAGALDVVVSTRRGSGGCVGAAGST